MDYLCYLDAADAIAALPEQAAQFSHGLPDDFGARGVPRFAAFRAETILEIAPRTVVCDWYQAGDATELLASSGVRVVVLEAVKGIAAIARNLEAVGAALGRAGQASRLAAALVAEAAAMRESAPAKRPRVLPYFSHGSGARTAGRATIEDLMIALAGARNAAAELGYEGHGQLAVERVLVAPPEFFLTGGPGQVAALRGSPALARLGAVRAGRILSLSSQLRNASSPYLLEAARRLRDLLAEHAAR